MTTMTRTESRDHVQIRETLAEHGIDCPDDLKGYKIEWIAGNMVPAITCPAPDGEPRRYNPRTNTGGRRIVCWL